MWRTEWPVAVSPHISSAITVNVGRGGSIPQRIGLTTMAKERAGNVHLTDGETESKLFNVGGHPRTPEASEPQRLAPISGSTHGESEGGPVPASLLLIS